MAPELLDWIATPSGAVALAALAGATIPLGAALANIKGFRPNWVHGDLRHSVAAFGGGALFSAIAFVLVPEASTRLNAGAMLTWFVAGGLLFFLIDQALTRRGGTGVLFLAMMLDYVPEAMALGALVTGDPNLALLTALLIAMQNLPEGFSAYREIMEHGAARAWKVMLLFCLMVPVGPLAALLGLHLLADQDAILGGVMAFAAGGILYLLFQDVAPGAHVANQNAPALGAVAGFALGLAGHLALG